MQVRGIDHVNIIAEDLESTAGFYRDLLGLRPERMSAVIPGFDGRWLFDAADRPIIHLMAWNAERHGELELGSATGAIDHVALACDGFDATIRRCEELGLEHRINDRRMGNLRQVFVTDPNNVTLELNFAGE